MVGPPVSTAKATPFHGTFTMGTIDGGDHVEGFAIAYGQAEYRSYPESFRFCGVGFLVGFIDELESFIEGCFFDFGWVNLEGVRGDAVIYDEVMAFVDGYFFFGVTEIFIEGSDDSHGGLFGIGAGIVDVIESIHVMISFL
jgi:hypothetical protein